MSVVDFKKPTPPSPDELFNAFWNAYPKRVGKGHARRAFVNACKIADPNTIVLGAMRFADHVKSEGTEMQYVPYPATWLNGERWDDELWQSESNWGDWDEL